jgi:hypothetical protein
MTDYQRRGGFALLAPAILLGGLGGYHHDAGWLLIGYSLALAVAIGWPRLVASTSYGKVGAGE